MRPFQAEFLKLLMTFGPYLLFGVVIFFVFKDPQYIVIPLICIGILLLIRQLVFLRTYLGYPAPVCEERG
jgi:hypothetical protein